MLVAMVALAIGTLSLVFSAGSLVEPQVYSKDFGQEYLLARAIRDGVDPYLPVRELAERYAAPIGFMDKTHPTPHPPSLGILLLPLSVLPYPAAAVAWFAIELACLLAAVGLLARAVGGQMQARAVPLVALALLAWPALLLDINLGQLTTPMLALLAAAQLALLRSRSVLGGALLGVSLLVKPIAWPWLIVLGAYGNWRAVALRDRGRCARFRRQRHGDRLRSTAALRGCGAPRPEHLHGDRAHQHLDVGHRAPRTWHAAVDACGSAAGGCDAGGRRCGSFAGGHRCWLAWPSPLL